MFRSGLLEGRRILVTGGGTGLGEAMARRFAELGASLVLSGRRAQVLEEAAARIRAESGADVQTIACDIRDAEAVERAPRRAPLQPSSASPASGGSGAMAGPLATLRFPGQGRKEIW